MFFLKPFNYVIQDNLLESLVSESDESDLDAVNDQYDVTDNLETDLTGHKKELRETLGTRKLF